MTDRERGILLLVTFSFLKEWINDIGGKINMDRPVIDLDPVCETVGCVGGWLADMFDCIRLNNDVRTELNYRGYSSGVDQLSSLLDFDDYSDLYKFIRLYWPNDDACGFFTACIAYNGDTSINNICNTWIECAGNIIENIKLREPKWL